MNRYNKGEWAELYTLAKLLGKGHLECQLTERRTLLVITQISRTSKTEKLEYSILENEITLNGESLIVTQQEILRLCVGLLMDLTAERPKAGAFESVSGDELATALKIKSIKAESKSKSDIQISILDPVTKEQVTSGYSIKLIGGNKSSIINASDHTRFVYEVHGVAPTTLKSSARLMAKGEPAKVIPLIHETGGWLKLRVVKSASYTENLCFVDTTMPAILAEALYQSYYCGKGRDMAKLATRMGSQSAPPNASVPFALHDPVGAFSRFASPERKHQWLVHKLKEFLIAHATSMNPSVAWDGSIAVTGGILVVDTTTGEITNNPIYDLNRLKQTLFDDCAFDSPSTDEKKGFNYGYIYFDKEGAPLLDLVLGVRCQ